MNKNEQLLSVTTHSLSECLSEKQKIQIYMTKTLFIFYLFDWCPTSFTSRIMVVGNRGVPDGNPQQPAGC